MHAAEHCYLRSRSANQAMKDRDASRHPGPMRSMQVDAESAGVFVAIGFALMLAVALPITKWFVLGTFMLGGLIALGIRVLRGTHRGG